MTSKRWLNLLLWGLGDRLDNTDDFRSDILMLVDALVWMGLLAFLVQDKTGFPALWIGAILVGQPIYWVGTQIAIGFLMTRSWKKKEEPVPALTVARPRGPAEQPASEEP